MGSEKSDCQADLPCEDMRNNDHNPLLSPLSSAPSLCNFHLFAAYLMVKKCISLSKWVFHWQITVPFNCLIFSQSHCLPPQTLRAVSTLGGSSMDTATGTSVGDTPGRTLRRTAESIMATWLASTAWQSITSSEVGAGWGGPEDKLCNYNDHQVILKLRGTQKPVLKYLAAENVCIYISTALNITASALKTTKKWNNMVLIRRRSSWLKQTNASFVH